MIVIVMGVSGSGKSHLANKLAQATGWFFAEGDDYHSPANKAKMAAGTPLNDEDRGPWLETLHQVLAGWERNGQSGILTCSALRASYRQTLTASLQEARFLWLDPPRSVLAERTARRIGHFMPASLLESQLATLEPPAEDSRTLRLTGTGSVEEQLAQARGFLGV